MLRRAATVSGMPDTPQEPTADYDERGVPSLDYVRDKIEGRYATAMGSQELTEDSAAGRSAAEREQAHKEAAEVKMAEIRRSLLEEMDK